MMDILDEIKRRRGEQELIGDLSSYLAYQFNNILQIIKGNVELVLLDINETDKNFDRLAEVYKAVQEGSFLTKRLIALNKEVMDLEEEEISNPSEDMSKFVKEGKEKILVVDDHAPIVDMMKEMLGKFQYEVVTEKDAKGCLEVLENDKDIDVVMLDFNLPDMNGIELTRQIKKSYPNIKVILTSGYSLNTYFREIYESGACAFLNKPFTLKELLKVIRKNLDDCKEGHYK